MIDSFLYARRVSGNQLEHMVSDLNIFLLLYINTIRIGHKFYNLHRPLPGYPSHINDPPPPSTLTSMPIRDDDDDEYKMMN